MVFVLMGVSGCGKSTIGRMLAHELQIPFYDADDFHSRENIRKMSAGHPLTNEDRYPWLMMLAEKIAAWNREGDAILACSAMKAIYRETLSSRGKALFIYLKGDKALILNRIRMRGNHFMPVELLNSQFHDLEEPDEAIIVPVDTPPADIVSMIICELSKRGLAAKKQRLIMNADIGIFGLGVMGQGLCLNLKTHGFVVSCYNREVKGIEEDVAIGFLKSRGAGKRIIGANSVKAFIETLKRPRKVMFMIKADAVDEAISLVLPYLEKGDVLIDGGNSDFRDTERRIRHLEEKGVYFIGAGISGGEEGALHGPAIMPGGAVEAWSMVRDIFSSIAAKLPDGSPCCTWIGPGGAGHFVKMVHNSIEYVEMEIIAETYHIMRELLSMTCDETALIFEEWNRGELAGYLISITAEILRKKEHDGGFLIERILDISGQKGTGMNAANTSLDLGIPTCCIHTAVSVRLLSKMKEERLLASRIFRKPELLSAQRESLLEDLRNAVLASKIISIAEGFSLLRAGSIAYEWHLDLAGIARIWQNGCIIKAKLFEAVESSCRHNPHAGHILFEPTFAEILNRCQKGWRSSVMAAIGSGIPVPCLASALSYFDGFRSGWLPANLIQAQRDFFGAHGYERIDHSGGEVFHTKWRAGF